MGAFIVRETSGKEHAPVPEDTHVARCVQLIDLGTSHGPYGEKHQCLVSFEIPSELRVYDEDRGPEPALIGKFYTLSLAEKSNLRRDLELWRGRAFSRDDLQGFDLRRLIGATCLLSVVHKRDADGRPKAHIAGISKLPSGIDCPPQVNPSRVYSIEESPREDFEALPIWIQRIIQQSHEFQRSTLVDRAAEQQPGGEFEYGI